MPKQRSLLETAQSTGIIRIMLLAHEFIRSSAFVIFDISKENVLLIIDYNDCCNLLRGNSQVNYESVVEQNRLIEKPFAFELISQESDDNCKIVEWYVVSMNIRNSSLAEQAKWVPIRDAIKLLTNNEERNILKFAMEVFEISENIWNA